MLRRVTARTGRCDQTLLCTAIEISQSVYYTPSLFLKTSGFNFANALLAGMIALQLKERRKSKKVSIPPLCVDTAGICNVSSDFSHPGLILTCLPQVLVLVQPLHAVQRWALSATIAETAVD